MLQGLYAHAPEDIEIHTFSLGSYEDEQHFVFASVRKQFFPWGVFMHWRSGQAIRAQKLDVLYYPEVGWGDDYRLACLR